MHSTLSFIAWLAWLACFIMVLIRMFKTGNTVLGIITAILGCVWIGSIIALVWGWLNASKLNMQNLMIIYTIALVIMSGIVGWAWSSGAFAVPIAQ